jgi:hypothetical protein
VTLFACSPISVLWDPAALFDGCFNLAAVQTSLTATNALLDAVVLGLPIVLLLRTTIDPKRKYFIFGIFAFGSIALLASFLRIMTTVVLLKTLDKPENWILFPIFTTLEVDVAITSASLPALSPLIRAGIQKVARYTGSSRLVSRFETSEDAEYGDTKRLNEHSLSAVEENGGIQVKREYSVVRSDSNSSESQTGRMAQPDQWRKTEEKMSPRAAQTEGRNMSLAEMLRNTGPAEVPGRRLGRGKANEILGV